MVSEIENQDARDNAIGVRASIYTERNDDIDDGGYVDLMEFRLVYQGPLPGSGNNARHPKEKHFIRKQIHKQLTNLWATHPLLNALQSEPWGRVEGRSFLEEYGKQMFGFEFLPLVHQRFDHICDLDILLLRRERPGGLITQGGDVDNRVKTLFDALSIPDSGSELGSPGPNETPFYCLLEKDKLVTQVRVTADRLWESAEQPEPQNYVYAIIKVKVQVAMEFKWGGQTFTRR